MKHHAYRNITSIYKFPQASTNNKPDDQKDKILNEQRYYLSAHWLHVY